MSKDASVRDTRRWADEMVRPVIGVSFRTTSRRTEVARHDHAKGQLVLTLSGVVVCEVGDTAWVVPAGRAVWIPGGQPHGLKADGNLIISILFVQPEKAAALPRHCCTITVSPLLRELLVATTTLPLLYDVDGPDGRMIAVLLDQLSAVPKEILTFALPVDPRLGQVMETILANPVERRTVAEWGEELGMSERSLSRLHRSQTGMSFVAWRRQIHLALAIPQLLDGASVQSVAFFLGYESSSSFITMFRKLVGTSPKRYLADRKHCQTLFEATVEPPVRSAGPG